jgi:hypothetical protein
MPFCPQCGFDLTGANPSGATSVATVEPLPVAAADPAAPPVTEPVAIRTPAPIVNERARGLPPVVIAGALVMIGLIAFGFLMRPVGPGASTAPSGGVAPPPVPGAASAAPSALISGLTILSPADGQAVATKDVNIIGTAPPGVTVTQDISFGLDQHTTSDGTGHWSMRVGLKDGENKLIFRIGDDASTRKEIRVTYTPQTP